MEKIVSGLLKSSHNIKLKNAFFQKLLESKQTPSENFNLNEFIGDIEKQWSIGLNFNLDLTNVSKENTCQNYESFTAHNDLIVNSLNYFLKWQDDLINNKIQLNSNNDDIFKPYSDLITHLINLIKLTFLPNLNRTNSVIALRNNVLLLITWLRLIIESFLANVKNVEFRFKLLSCMAILNSNLYSLKNSENTFNYLYLIQNDVKFCSEYVRFVSSLMIPLVDFNANARSEYEAFFEKNFNQIYAFIEKCLYDTICLLMLSVSKEQTLNAEYLKDDSESFKKEINFKDSYNNLNDIVNLIRLFINKSNKLFELSFQFLIDLLISDDLKAVDLATNKLTIYTGAISDLLKCFDLTRATLIIKNFLEDTSTSSSIDDKSLKLLLSNLILLLSWPFESNVDEWICSLMAILAIKSQKFQLLVSICEENCDFVLKLISHKVFRKPSLNVLSFFLINYQHSPKLFHKCCPKIVKLLEKLKPPSSDEMITGKSENEVKSGEAAETCDSKSYQHLALLSFICITNFGGYPQIYKPILDIIQKDLVLTNYDSFKSKYLINKSNDILKMFSDDNEDMNSSFSKNDENEIENEKENKKVRQHITGLINLGNTCYLNCMVQSLFSCKKFVKSILEIDIENNNENSFLNQLQILFGIMFMTQRHAIKAANFIKYCTPQWFRFGQQQDSSEFLIYFLDNLAEQLKQLNKDTQTPSSYETLIQKSFGIQLTTECLCNNCGTKTKRSDISFYLPLSFSSHSTMPTPSPSPLPQTSSLTKKPKQSLQKLIDNFFSTELLSSENDNPYSCSKCESLQSASKRVYFTRDDAKDIQPPDYLVFTLNRFIYKASAGSNNIKIMDQLDYPSEIYVNTYHNDQIITERYSILSIVVHSGSSLHYGHYYSYITNDFNELSTQNDNDKLEWLLANDSQISETTFESLISNLELFKDDTPYVLFYKRIENKPKIVVPVNSQNEQAKIELNQEEEQQLGINIKNKKLTDIIQQDNQIYLLEEKNRLINKKKNKNTSSYSSKNKKSNSSRDDDDDDDQNGSRSSTQSHYCSNDSERESGPRIVF